MRTRAREARRYLGVCAYRLLREFVARNAHVPCACGSRAKRPWALAKQLKMPDWKAKKVAAAARLWSAAELRAALSSARDCERAMKSGADAEGVFFDWAISTCAKK